MIIFLINKNICHIFKSPKQNDYFYDFSYFLIHEVLLTSQLPFFERKMVKLIEKV